MNFNSPRLEPKKVYDKPKTENNEKREIASKPDQKPNDKPKNKIERLKIDLNTPPRNKIERPKIDLNTPIRNKIERPKIDLNTPTRNKIEHYKFDAKTPSKHKIEPRKIDPNTPSRHKLEPRKTNPMKEPKHKIQHKQYDNNIDKTSQKIKIKGNNENLIKTNKEVNNSIVKTYDRESSRVQVKKSQLKHIYSELKERGFTLDTISQIIGCNFRNSLYKDCSLSRDSFNKLQDLFGLEITHEIKDPIVKPIDLKINENLAELVGVVLGDGHLSKSGNTLSITLNFVEEGNYVKYVKDVFGKVLNIEPSTVELQDNKANQIRVYGKGIIDAFVKLGLKTGNKVDNQVGVPNWIKNNKKYCASCLKGLFDTDGSIYLTSDKKRIAMNFKNNSRPLVESFKEMCEKLAIKTNKMYEGWTYSRGKQFKHYKVEMFKQDQIKRFISIVNPEKWLNRKERFIEILKNKRSSWSSVFNSQ